MTNWLFIWCSFLIAALAFGCLALLAESQLDEEDHTRRAALTIFMFGSVLCGVVGWLGILGWFVNWGFN